MKTKYRKLLAGNWCTSRHESRHATARIKLISTFLAFAACAGIARALPFDADANSCGKYAQKLKAEYALLKAGPQVLFPSAREKSDTGKYRWKCNIVTTTFWIGESATKNNPVPNRTSAWDAEWARNYGGSDSPEFRERRNYIPVGFTPGQNPFYVALPYNDVIHGTTKTEAARIIPWFKQAFRKSGETVCKDRWIAIRRGDRVVYAQWEDCGPFRTDHWEYVFGDERPKPNLNHGAGLDVSPAVRDYLRMNDTDVTDWHFVDFSEVPPGPWTQYGDNNTFVLRKRKAAVASALARNNGTPIVEIN